MHNLNMLREIILVSLVKAGEKGATASEALPDKQRKLVGTARIKGMLDQFTEDGHAEFLPGKRKGSGRWRLSSRGREAAEKLLAPIDRKSNTWLTKALRLVAVTHKLGLEPRVAARCLGLETLTASLLAAHLGEDFRPGVTTVTSLARRVAARELGVNAVTEDALWQGVFRQALAEGPAEAPAPAPTSAPEISAGFAREVFAAAAPEAEGWAGYHRVLISRAWELWKDRADAPNLDLEGFKHQLYLALRRGELELTRADFPEGLTPQDLERAVIRAGNEEFHYLTIPTR